MSPEQARGKPVDRRADLWSFGCVLYECLTGINLFAGETVSDSLAAILRKDPDWSKLPEDTPPMVRLLLRRCLTRDPVKRLRDAGDARLELEQAIEDPQASGLGLSVAATAGPAVGPSAVTRWLPWAVAAAALAGLAFFALRGGTTPVQTNAVSHRLQIPVPGPTQFGDELAAPPVISPDGRHVVFGVIDRNNQSSLYLRSIDVFEPRQLNGTNGGQYPFWSPDSRHLGFHQGGRLKRVEIATGRVQPIGGSEITYPRGGSWSRDGKIVYSPSSNAGIHVIDAAGGTTRQLTTPDPDVPDSSHRWPHFLPDGEHFLFLYWTNDLASREKVGGVYVGSLSGADPVRIAPDASSMAYGPSGHLLVVQEDNLIAIPFDADTRKVIGEARIVTTGVLRMRASGYGAFSVSAEGTLVYAKGESALAAQLNWYDREGKATPTPLEPAPFTAIRLSPDSKKAVAVMPGPSGDGELWTIDLLRGVRTRFASATWTFNNALWSGAGDRIMFTSQQRGHSNIYIRAADGSGEQQEGLIIDQDMAVYDWSADGKYVLYWQIETRTSDLHIYSMEDEQSVPLIVGDPSYADARFSPDADYVTYSSDESGRPEIFAHARVGGARWQVSTNGGAGPHWSQDGKEIVYVDPERRIMAVPVDTGLDGLSLGTPRELFQLSGIFAVGDASVDHERFLIAMLAEFESEPLHVILNWPAGL
jgi:Tol biopolymer transport system component